MADLFGTIIQNASTLDYADFKSVSYPGLSGEQATLCESLKYYRDTALREDYTKLAKRYLIKNDVLDMIKQIKNDLVNTNSWKASSELNGIGQLLIVIKRTCNLIEILVPANKTNKATLEGYKLYKLYRKYGKKLQDMATQGEMQFIKADDKLQNYLDLFNVIQQSAKELTALVKESEKFNNDWKTFRVELSQQVSRLDKQINDYNSVVVKSMEELLQVSELSNYINNYLNENCNKVTSMK